jgi:predicted nucleotidyltransferase component of viral defense system
MVMNWELLEKIKKLTIQALVSDDELMDKLILKGGNALDLIHKIAARASLDLDFSIVGSFDDDNLDKVESKIESLLLATFKENGYIAYDIKLSKKPGNMDKETDLFWGGYKIEFKVIDASKYDQEDGVLEAVRRQSLVLGARNSTILRIEISRFEYCPNPDEMELDGYTLYVYSPTLIAIEKLRAVCQQMDRYKNIIPSATFSPRARDFFDIYTIINACNINLHSSENRLLLKAVFDAKKVPLGLLHDLEDYREFHRQDFIAVKDTTKPGIELQNYDFYFDFVKSICDTL